jgi:hypothetical protein
MKLGRKLLKKKIFRIYLVLLIAVSALAFSGCTSLDEKVSEADQNIQKFRAAEISHINDNGKNFLLVQTTVSASVPYDLPELRVDLQRWCDNHPDKQLVMQLSNSGESPIIWLIYYTDKK